MSKEISMIMFGPSGVGKTSLLATMKNELSRLVSGFAVAPDSETGIRLNEAYLRLAEVMKQETYTQLKSLVEGNQKIIDYRFEVFFGRKKEFDLVFHDVRGGSIVKGGTDLPELEEKIDRSQVIFNVLDAAALMESESDPEAQEYNAHIRTRDMLLTNLMKKPTKKRLILYVLVKSERWASEYELLREKFEMYHGPVLNALDPQCTVGVLIPVSTLGCVEFSRRDGENYYVFVRKPGFKFEPKDVDRPLRYALAFSLSQIDGNRGLLERLGHWFSGRDKQFMDEMKRFCDARDQDKDGRPIGYKVYGNGALLQ